MEIQLWRSILCPYELAVKELTVKFKHMIEEYHENDRYSPIEQVSGRVKSVSSILEKMQRKQKWKIWQEYESFVSLKKISIPLLRSSEKEQIWKSKVKRTI